MTDPMLLHLPPHNIEIEQSVIAGCIIDPEICTEVLDILNETDFYRTAHQEIFKAIRDLHYKKEPVDLSTIWTKLKESGSLEKVGGASSVAKFTDYPIPISTEYYCNKLRSCTILRNTINLCAKTQQACFQANDNALKVIDDFQKKCLALDANIVIGTTYSDMKSLVEEGLDRYEALWKNNEDITGIPSGFTQLDQLTCGFQGSDLIILAARPSMGKSALALNFSVNMAKAGIPSVIFSLEMAKSQFYDRTLSSESGINSVKFRNGKFSSDEWLRINEVSSRLYDYPVYIEDQDCFDFMSICRKARILKKNKDIRAIIIDYLQLIKGDPRLKRNYQIEEISRGFKQLAKEFNVPVIVLAQLNRQCENRDNKRPMLSDLKDSGAIEQDADVVMFLYRHEKYIKKQYNEDKTKTPEFEKWQGRAELDIAKQRMGPVKRIQLSYLEKTTTFKNLFVEKRNDTS